MFKIILWIVMMLAAVSVFAGGLCLMQFFKQLVNISLHCEMDNE